MNTYSHSLFNNIVDINTNMPLVSIPIKDPSENNRILGGIEIVSSKLIENIFSKEEVSFG